MFKCRICNTELDLDKCHFFKSKCFINNIDLIRHKCTTCGVIFGTLDMINGTTEKTKQDYVSLDLVYKESNAVEYETRTFMSLNPKKDGIYLNFGSGNACSTINNLRSQGWNIIGYEPYLPNSSPNIIKNKEDLLKYKFDGIMSNNLLEHLQDPVQDLLFMKSLLKGKTDLMARSTPCYKYCCEISKYHLYFFVDKSIEYLCLNSGLFVVKTIQENTPCGEYINYVYAQK
jgi:hypothetical protein